jgi:AAA15 family ATPase/GTPase
MAGYIERITGTIPHTNKSVDIPLDGKNLIITGGNGSGKTSFLRSAYDKTVSFIVNKKQVDLLSLKKQLQLHTESLARSTQGTSKYNRIVGIIRILQEKIEIIETGIHPIIPDNINFSAKHDERKAVILYFEDKRLANITEAKNAQGLQSEIEENKKAAHNQNIGSKLEQHLLNMQVRQAFALTKEKNQDLADTFDSWFTDFEKNLQHLFEDDSTKLCFDPNNNKFSIQQNDKPPYTFQTLSAGYRAIFDIYADLLMRTEYFEISPTELKGVVFIDEIDSHLHVSLQRLILPFFTESFPNVQFIVTTHSPFVLWSTQNTVVYDLDKEESYTITQAKSQNEILTEYLGVPIVMPVWAEKKLEEILDTYINSDPEKISLSALKEDLTKAGLEEYFPESTVKILEHN